MDSGFAALLGALIGGGATVAANYIQMHTSRTQQRIKTAAELASKEHDFDVVLRKEGKKLPYSMISQYVGFHDAILRELEKGQGITVKRLEELSREYDVDPDE